MMKKNKNKKRTNKIILFIKALARLIDKKIINPITKFILILSEKMGSRTDKFERWLVRKNTLIFISLVLAIVAFIIVDKKQHIFMNMQFIYRSFISGRCSIKDYFFPCDTGCISVLVNQHILIILSQLQQYSCYLFPLCQQQISTLRCRLFPKISKSYSCN